ncbi:peptidase M23 [Clostridium sp. CAG:465]|nr:peptidase M23 [Clostridium sp. CAG:465]
MKIKINKVFNKEGTIKLKNNKNEEKTDTNEENIKRRRKGACVKDNKKINLKECFQNLFRNKGNLSKGYYVLLFGMLVLGTASVAITFKAYNLFAKEDYDFYEQSSDNEENNVVSTISSIDENANEGRNLVNSNAAEAKKSETKSPSNTNITKTQNKVTVKPLTFSKPLNGQIQKPYSIDKVIYSKTLELWKTHDGIDISSQIGENVKSIEKGTVEKVYDDSFYGTTVVIDHGQGYKSSYSNLNSKVSVKEKQTVTKGQVIGKVSNTSIGEIKDEAHLHFTLFKDNNNVDPTYIFK